MMQSLFAHALLDPHAPSPAITTDPGARFNVYRNNYIVSLRNALRTTFPAVERLVGSDFFTALADAFAQRHPPRSPIMAHYGDGFAGFTEGFAALHDYPYLGDVARLEYARVRAYHAADAEGFNLSEDDSVIAALDCPAQLHPSVSILPSQYPAHSIWHAQVSAGASTQPEWIGEIALVWRQDPYGSVEAKLIDPHEQILFAHFATGGRLATLLAGCSDQQAVSTLITTFIDLAAAGSIVPSQYPIPIGDDQ